MNVYQKLSKARQELKSRGLKQTGRNKGVGYGYFDLSDFLPSVTEIEAKIGLLSVVRFEAERATLTVYDTDDNGGSVEFTSPMSTAELRGCHPVQNLGAAETYVRRYLYLAAYEIVEADALDGGEQGKSGDNRTAPEQTEGFAPEEYKCSVCGKVIPQKLFEQSLKKYGAPLCSAECLAKLKEAEKAHG